MSEKHRASWLTVSEQYALNAACRPVGAIGYGTFHVGSSLARPDYHDVDLRCCLPDDEFDQMFGGDKADRLPFLNAAISEWIAARTGLPIDFQFQRSSDANEKYPSPEHPRNGVGH